MVLQGLVKSPDLNGKEGTVKSEFDADTGRQQVFVRSLSKTVALKLENLQYQERSVDSLSVGELKTILRFKKVAEPELSGIDKTELKVKLASMVSSDTQVCQWLAEANAKEENAKNLKSKKKNKHGNNNMNNMQPQAAADQLSQMSPEQLRQQALMMRTNPALVRRSDPSLAHMSDDQIRQAATQMEMMANNPSMMKMAAEKMKKMSPEELKRMQGQMGGAAPAANTAASAQQAASTMANMTPEQLKQQAEMMKNMSPDQVRAMNPQLAHMSDAQIKQAAQQMEMMASNPSMMQMAMDQMKNMTPEQIEALQKQGVGGGAGAGGMGQQPDLSSMMKEDADPSELLANMDPKQLKSMLQSLKTNPDMRKQMSQMSGMSEEQLMKGIEIFGNMEDDKMEAAMKMMGRAAKAKDGWNKVNAKVGGHLFKIVIVLSIVMFYLALMAFVSWKSGGGIAASDASDTAADPIPEVVDSEF